MHSLAAPNKAIKMTLECAENISNTNFYYASN